MTHTDFNSKKLNHHGPKHQRAASQLHETQDFTLNLNGTMNSDYHDMSITGGLPGANDTFGN